jgi:hypothetical protein
MSAPDIPLPASVLRAAAAAKRAFEQAYGKPGLQPSGMDQQPTPQAEPSCDAGVIKIDTGIIEAGALASGAEPLAQEDVADVAEFADVAGQNSHKMDRMQGERNVVNVPRNVPEMYTPIFLDLSATSATSATV